MGRVTVGLCRQMPSVRRQRGFSCVLCRAFCLCVGTNPSLPPSASQCSAPSQSALRQPQSEVHSPQGDRDVGWGKTQGGFIGVGLDPASVRW